MVEGLNRSAGRDPLVLRNATKPDPAQLHKGARDTPKRRPQNRQPPSSKPHVAASSLNAMVRRLGVRVIKAKSAQKGADLPAPNPHGDAAPHKAL